jgi:hypothetical protein
MLALHIEMRLLNAPLAYRHGIWGLVASRPELVSLCCCCMVCHKPGAATLAGSRQTICAFTITEGSPASPSKQKLSVVAERDHRCSLLVLLKWWQVI